MVLIEPESSHECATPKSTRPMSDWPVRTVFGQSVKVPRLYDIDSLWQCPTCGDWWRCCDYKPPFDGVYHGGGREWRRVRWWNYAARERIRKFEEGSTGEEVTDP
jgi:hypothetical protein